MDPCPVGQVTAVRLDELGDHFRRYRLRVPQAVQAMAQSLRRWGQCAPIVATLREEKPQVLDGFTRWEAARQVRGMTTLLVRLIEVDDRRAKAAIYGLNQTGRRPYELEEAWLVQVAGARGRPVPGRGGRAAGPAQELGLPAAGLAGEARRRRPPGPGGRPPDADGGAGDRPVARGQPIGSPRSVAARGARAATSSAAWSACSWGR